MQFQIIYFKITLFYLRNYNLKQTWVSDSPYKKIISKNICGSIYTSMDFGGLPSTWLALLRRKLMPNQLDLVDQLDRHLVKARKFYAAANYVLQWPANFQLGDAIIAFGSWSLTPLIFKKSKMKLIPWLLPMKTSRISFFFWVFSSAFRTLFLPILRVLLLPPSPNKTQYFSQFSNGKDRSIWPWEPICFLWRLSQKPNQHSHPHAVCLANPFHSSSYSLLHAFSVQPPSHRDFSVWEWCYSGFECWVLVCFDLFRVLRLFGCESWVLSGSALCYLLGC